MKFKKIVSIFITAAAVFNLAAPMWVIAADGAETTAQATQTEPTNEAPTDSVFKPDFEVTSEAAYLVNMDSGVLIYSKNAEQKFDPSSLAQIMTAIIVIEKVGNLDAEVTANVNLYAEFDDYREKNEGLNVTVADVLPGEKLTVRDLLYGTLLQSGCECANILADYVSGGNIANFVLMMNAKAEELGCNNTRFTNPHGLPDDEQYTTARDMAIISRHAMNMAKFSELCNQYSYKIKATNKHTNGWTLYHSNSMLNSASEYYYSYAQGIKTSNSKQSGRSLVTTVRKSGNRYLLVLMNSPLADAEGNYIYGNYTDAKKLLNWTLTMFEYRVILSADEEIDGMYVLYADGDGYVNLKPAESYSTLWLSTLSINSSVTRKTKLNYDKYEDGKYFVHAPVKKGDILGKLTLLLGDREIYTVDLIAASDVQKSSLSESIALAKHFPGSFQFKLALVFSILFFVGYTVIMIKLKKNYDAKKSAEKQATKKKAPASPAAKLRRPAPPANIPKDTDIDASDNNFTE